jgi:phage shock protein A
MTAIQIPAGSRTITVECSDEAAAPAVRDIAEILVDEIARLEEALTAAQQRIAEIQTAMETLTRRGEVIETAEHIARRDARGELLGTTVIKRKPPPT